MKTINRKFLFYSVLVGMLCFLQSCGGVYNAPNITLENALEMDQPLKIKTTDGTVYKVNKLEKDDTGIYGVAREESNAARKHKEKITERDYQGKYVKIDIPENSIEEIRTKNKGLSILLPVTIGVAIIGGFIFAVSNLLVVMP